ncbi:pilus assembly protein PilM [Massilia arenosa]|uniref:Pilus assembly protein PilM n=1 Tax=Zemynaea arenosa TaxID=2561931 RepID=A0A4Y9SE50_9BURK|nr:pilus assembly protein PilM [Massilia arenosa]
MGSFLLLRFNVLSYVFDLNGGFITNNCCFGIPKYHSSWQFSKAAGAHLNLDLATLFGQSNAPLVGLDISSSGVRLVELAQVGKTDIRLERYASEPLPRGAVVDGNIENLDQVSEAVRRVWKKSGTRVKNVALGMPPAAVITKKIILPAGLSEDQLEVQVESEASQYIPFALDEVSLDFDVIGPAATPEDMEVMLAAARKEKVEDRVAIAEAAGLKATVMDIESYAARAALDRITGQLPHAGADQIVALFQIGAQVTHISVMLDGETIYEREQPFGGAQLTQEIVRAFGLSYEEAEAKKKAGDLPENYRTDLLNPFLENAALEVTRAIQFFYTSTPYTRIDQLYLAGGCAMLPGLLDIIASRTKISSAVISPFKGMQLGEGVREQQLRTEAPAYLVATGLALRRFDR